MKEKLILFIIFMLIISTVSVYAETALPEQTKENSIIRLLDVDWWESKGHDPQNSGFSTTHGPENNSLLWQSTIIDPIYYSHAVADGKVFVGGGGTLYCFDAYDGSEIWQFQTTSSSIHVPAFYDDKVYVTGDLSIHCVDAEGNGDGTTDEIWHYYDINYIFLSSPVATDGKVFAADSFGFRILCLDAYNGSEIWEYITLGEILTSPAYYDGNIFFGTSYGDGKVICLDGETGTELWAHNTGSAIGDFTFDPFIISYEKVFVGTATGITRCLDAETGSLVRTIFKYGNMATGYDNLYIHDDDGDLFCIDLTNGAIIWNYTVGSITYGAPIVADDKVYVTNSTVIYCVDAEGNGDGTTTLIWRESVNRISGGAAIADGKLYVTSFDGDIYCFGSNDPPAEPILEIGNINGGLASISADISNSGNADAINVNIEIEVSGGILGLIDKNLNVTHDDVPSGQTIVESIQSIMGFGPIEINVTASADNVEEVTKTANGFVFFFFVLLTT